MADKRCCYRGQLSDFFEGILLVQFWPNLQPPPLPSPPNQGESSVTCMFLSRTSQIQGSQLLVVVLTGRVGFEDA